MSKDHDWNDCMQNNTAKEVTLDFQKAKSLQHVAQGRIDFFESLTPTENTVNYFFEGYYTSILEFLHAHLCEVGYKVINHLCLTYYLNEVLQRPDLHRLFDDCRLKRNNLQYYGRFMDEQTAHKAIQNCKKLITEIKKIS